MERRAAAPCAAQPECRDIIAIGGSSGALDTLLGIAPAFPAAFSGSLFIVSHIGDNPSHLPALLSRAGRLPAKHPQDGEPIRPATIYVAPPDRHMLIEDGRIGLSRGPREHFTRPAIDPLFRSAARHFGTRVIGVVLSGAGSDGAAGLLAIRQAGGVAITQDPSDAMFPDMPRSAVATVRPDYVVDRTELPALLLRLASEKPGPRVSSAAEAKDEMHDTEQPAALTCPECGGALRQIDGGLLQYRCHIGHRFGADEIAGAQSNEIERAVLVAVRVLNERIELCNRMIEHAGAGRGTERVGYWRRTKAETAAQLNVLQRFLGRQPGGREVEA